MKSEDYNDNEFLPEGKFKFNPEEWKQFDPFEDFFELDLLSFEEDEMIDCLKEIGYKIKEDIDSITGDTIFIAYKEGEEIPIEYNVDIVFYKEIRKRLLKIILKYGK